MARRVFFHIAAPKTGTTYLQTLLWSNRARLADSGVLLPGRGRPDHWFGALVVREDPRIAEKPPRATGAWDRIVADCAEWPGDAVITHELFGPATPEQALRAVTDLAPAEVHLVVTARNPLSVFTAAWQELLRWRGITTPLADFDLSEPAEAQDNWRWSNLDPAEVLTRWGPAVPASRVHVLPMPGPTYPRDELWRRFAGMIGVDPDAFDLDASFENASMGLVETEVLRRANHHLRGVLEGHERARWVRDYLCRDLLVPRGGQRPLPPQHRIEECRARGDAAIETIREAGYDVIGDLEDLRVPETRPTRSPDSVSDGEVADLATELVASLLVAMRDTKQAGKSQRSGQAKAQRKQTATPAPSLSRRFRRAMHRYKLLR